jgi:hypothetical protein
VVRAQLFDGLPQADVPGQLFTLMDFHIAFVMASLLTLLSVMGYIRLPRGAGASLGGGMRRSKKDSTPSGGELPPATVWQKKK